MVPPLMPATAAKRGHRSAYVLLVRRQPVATSGPDHRTDPKAVYPGTISRSRFAACSIRSGFRSSGTKSDAWTPGPCVPITLMQRLRSSRAARPGARESNDPRRPAASMAHNEFCKESLDEAAIVSATSL